MEPTAQTAETPQIIELEPASRLQVRFRLGIRTRFDPLKSVSIALKFHGQALAWMASGDRDSRRSAFPYGLVHGAQFKGRVGREDEWDDALHFRGLPDRDLWIDGLQPGARILVVAHDRLGGVLASKHVVMPPAGDSSTCTVDFGNLYEAGAATLMADCKWQGSDQSFEGWVALTSQTGRIERIRSSQRGRVEEEPLAPGRYRIVARTNGNSPRPGEGVEVVLVPGMKTLTIDAIGPEPD